MEIEDLRVFVEIADAGGVNSAARRLGLAKSIVSRRLLRLEDELGAQLVARTTRGVVLTEAGAHFRDEAAKVCAVIDNAREDMSPAGALRGLLRVAAPASFGRQLAPVLAELAQRHKDLHVHIRFNDRYVDLAAEGFDCAIRVGYLSDSNLVARKVGELPVRLYASPTYLSEHGEPQTPSDVLQHSCLTPGADVWNFRRGGETIPLRPQGRFKADNAFVIAEAAARGVGIAVLGEIIAAPYVAEGALTPVLQSYDLPAVGIYIVRPQGQHLPRKVRVLIDLLAEAFATPSAANAR
ncbi:LysR family transcriptional regulator [Methylopila henanensis]|uniref:LysR family transcriptional regulator n=1 Tax=Methylopila henanensis TaxID=873516 RepID=A0ABW4K909_9HYPH